MRTSYAGFLRNLHVLTLSFPTPRFSDFSFMERPVIARSARICSVLALVIDSHPFADPLRFRHASGEMIAFRVVPHGPECMRDTRELVLARPTRWRCSPDLESELGGHSAAQPDLLPHPVRIVAVRAACRGIERVNRFVRNKLLDAVDLRSEEHTYELQSLMSN